MRRRVLLVARTRYRLPLDPSLTRKFAALRAELDVRVLASAPAGAPTGDETFQLVPPLSPAPLDGAAFYVALPLRIARELRAFRPDAVLTQTAFEAAAALVARRLAGSRAKVVVDVHGDWRTATRLYGSPLRRALSPLADRLAGEALRHADAVRTVSPYTSGLVRQLGVEPADEFPAFLDLDAFTEAPPAPLPETPQGLFVGVLERYKNVDGLAAAWRLAAPRVPDARLLLVGDGTLRGVAEGLAASLPEQTAWVPRLDRAGVARALDESTALLLPSRSEGMGRVIVEAFVRGRPVVGSRAGSIPDLVADGESGLLVDPDDPASLAGAIVRVLGDRALAERLAAGARAAAAPWLQTPEEYAARTRALVERVAGG